MIEYLYQREPAVKHIIPLKSFVTLLLVWSCWEGLSAVALVSVQRKYSLWVISAAYKTMLCFLGSLVVGIISHLQYVDSSILSKRMINWLGRSYNRSNKRFGDLEPRLMFRPHGRAAGSPSGAKVTPEIPRYWEKSLAWPEIGELLKVWHLFQQGSRASERDGSISDVVGCILVRARLWACGQAADGAVPHRWCKRCCLLPWALSFSPSCVACVQCLPWDLLGTELCLSIERQNKLQFPIAGKHSLFHK